MALYFNGTSTAYVRISAAGDLSRLERPTGRVSMALWLYRDGAQDQFDRISEKEYANASTQPYVSYGFEFWTGNQAFFQVGTTDTTLTRSGSSIVPADRAWTPLVGTYEQAASTRVRCYSSNGRSEGAPGVNFPIAYGGSNNHFDIGGRGADGNWMKGGIGRLAVWDDTLSAQEAEEFCRGKHPTLIRPASLIYFDELDRLRAPDRVGKAGASYGAGNALMPAPPFRTLRSLRRQVVVAGAPPPPPAGIVQRRTLVRLGTRTGSRQVA